MKTARNTKGRKWERRDCERGRNGGRLFIGRDSNVGAVDRPHATVNAHKTLCALGAGRDFIFLKHYFYSSWGGRPPPRDIKCAQISVRRGGGWPPQRDFIFLKIFFIHVGAVDRPNAPRQWNFFFKYFFYAALGRVLFLWPPQRMHHKQKKISLATRTRMA